MAGQAPVVRDYLLGHTVGGDAVAAGLLGEALVVGRHRRECLAYRVQQCGSRLLDDVGLVDLESPNSAAVITIPTPGVSTGRLPPLNKHYVSKGVEST